MAVKERTATVKAEHPPATKTVHGLVEASAVMTSIRGAFSSLRDQRASKKGPFMVDRSLQEGKDWHHKVDSWCHDIQPVHTRLGVLYLRKERIEANWDAPSPEVQVVFRVARSDTRLRQNSAPDGISRNPFLLGENLPEGRTSLRKVGPVHVHFVFDGSESWDANLEALSSLVADAWANAEDSSERSPFHQS